MSPKSRTRKRTKPQPKGTQAKGHPAARSRPQARPMSVAIVAAVALLSALYQAIFAIRMFMEASGPETVSGLLLDVSDTTWVIHGILAAILALGYLWVARGLMARDRQARSTMMILSGINIVFGLFQLPYGAIALGLSGAAFFLLISFPVKDWFGIKR